MTSAIGDVGTGAAITFDSSYLGKILNIEWGGISRPAIKITSFGDTIDQFVAGDLYDPGELVVDVLCDPTQLPAISGGEEAITLDFGGGASTAHWDAQGFLTSFTTTLPLEDKIVATATIKFTGAITITTPA